MTAKQTPKTTDELAEQLADELAAVGATDTAKQIRANVAAAKKAPAKKTPARKPAAKKTAPATLKGSWAKRNPEKVALIPARIASGQHPQVFADEFGISLSIAWRLFKAEGWQASGKGGGKAFVFKTAADRRKAEQALKVLSSLGTPATVIRALQRDRSPSA